MDKIRLTNEIISKIKKEAFELTHRLMGGDLKAVILYGSCVRGDFAEDSDDGLDVIATKLAMKYFAVVNFVCLPEDEFLEKKAWYGYFQNIEREGVILYG